MRRVDIYLGNSQCVELFLTVHTKNLELCEKEFGIGFCILLKISLLVCIWHAIGGEHSGFVVSAFSTFYHLLYGVHTTWKCLHSFFFEIAQIFDNNRQVSCKRHFHIPQCFQHSEKFIAFGFWHSPPHIYLMLGKASIIRQSFLTSQNNIFFISFLSYSYAFPSHEIFFYEEIFALFTLLKRYTPTPLVSLCR